MNRFGVTLPGAANTYPCTQKNLTEVYHLYAKTKICLFMQGKV